MITRQWQLFELTRHWRMKSQSAQSPESQHQPTDLVVYSRHVDSDAL